MNSDIFIIGAGYSVPYGFPTGACRFIAKKIYSAFGALRGVLHHSGAMRTRQQVAKCCPPARKGSEQRSASEGKTCPSKIKL